MTMTASIFSTSALPIRLAAVTLEAEGGTAQGWAGFSKYVNVCPDQGGDAQAVIHRWRGGVRAC